MIYYLIIQSEIFHSRQTTLSLPQGKKYGYKGKSKIAHTKIIVALHQCYKITFLVKSYNSTCFDVVFSFYNNMCARCTGRWEEPEEHLVACWQAGISVAVLNSSEQCVPGVTLVF